VGGLERLKNFAPARRGLDSPLRSGAIPATYSRKGRFDMRAHHQELYVGTDPRDVSTDTTGCDPRYPKTVPSDKSTELKRKPGRERAIWSVSLRSEYRTLRQTDRKMGGPSAARLARRTAFGSRLAEGVGFEPTIRFPVYTLSKRAPSATRPPLRKRGDGRNIATRLFLTTQALGRCL
jgi:hypothetical protein